MHPFPGIDPALGVQVIGGMRLAALILDMAVPSTDALQTIGGVEAQEVGEGMPLEHPRIDLPFIAGQGKTRALAIGVAQNRVELFIGDALQLQFARGLFEGQALIRPQIRREQHRACGCQKQYGCAGAVGHAAQDAPPSQTTDCRREKQETNERADND